MESSEGVLLFFFIGGLILLFIGVISGGIGAIIGSSFEKGVVGFVLGAFIGPIVFLIWSVMFIVVTIFFISQTA